MNKKNEYIHKSFNYINTIYTLLIKIVEYRYCKIKNNKKQEERNLFYC